MIDVIYDEWALQEVRERRFLINRFDRWIFEEITPFIGQRVLEVGCGLGNLMCHLVDREVVVGIDLDTSCIEYLHQGYQGYGNIQAFPFDICDSRVLRLRTFHFDTVISLNVFEHIEDDMLALCHVRELLEPGGNLILIVPAHPWLYGSMDSAIGHYRRYTKSQMNSKLGQVGFTLLAQKYLNVLGAVGWLFNGRILKAQVPPTGQLHLFNKIVPLLRAVEQQFSTPVGISLLSVAKCL